MKFNLLEMIISAAIIMIAGTMSLAILLGVVQKAYGIVEKINADTEKRIELYLEF